MSLTIKKGHGFYEVSTAKGKTIAATLERALEDSNPGAPADKLQHAADILEPLIGEGHKDISHGVSSL